MPWPTCFRAILPSRATALLALCLGVVCGNAVAQPENDIFPDQRLIYTAKNPDIAYRLTLGALNKINGEWVAERETLVDGQLLGRTVEVGRPYTYDSAWLKVQQRFADRQAVLIFSCEGMACGSSNAWANERFGVDQLYGLDLTQRYQVWQVSYHGVNYFAAVYLVQRGNKRVYFQLDMLRPNDQSLSFAPSEAVIASTFYRDKQIEVGGLSFEQGNIVIDRNYLKAYASAFNRRPFHSLVIVGHDYHPGDGAAQEQRALTHAQAVKTALVNLGVQARRLDVKAVGAMAPQPNSSAPARVVVLLK